MKYSDRGLLSPCYDTTSHCCNKYSFRPCLSSGMVDKSGKRRECSNRINCWYQDLQLPTSSPLGMSFNENVISWHCAINTTPVNVYYNPYIIAAPLLKAKNRSGVIFLTSDQVFIHSVSHASGALLFIRVSQKNTFKKIKSGTHHASAWGLVWTDSKGFLISTKGSHH